MEQLYYIQSGSEGDAAKWWKDKTRGETIDLREAGTFTIEEVNEICKFRKNKPFPVEEILQTTNAQKLIFQKFYLKGLLQL